MNAPSAPQLVAPPPAEQGRYATWLDTTSKVGLLMLIVGFLAYAFGVVPPHIPVERLPELWIHPTHVFREHTGHPTGWDWLAMLHKGDIFNLLGIAVLAGGSMLCLLAVIPLYARRGEHIYVAVCALQAGVLGLAASGLLTAGH